MKCALRVSAILTCMYVLVGPLAGIGECGGGASGVQKLPANGREGGWCAGMSFHARGGQLG